MQTRRAIVALSALLATSPLLAQGQDSIRAGSVGGTVFDSVTMRVIADATVQLVLKSEPYGKVYTALSDAKGRYEIPNVPPGYYLIAFQHAALDSLTLSSPIHAVDVMRGNRTIADLAVPSAPRIVAAFCGATPSDTLGVLFGTMRDARTREPVNTGSVVVRWTDLVIALTGSRVEERVMSTQVGADGNYVLCGLAPEGDVVLVGTSGADSTGAILVTVPAHGLLKRDFSIGGRAVVHGVVNNGTRPLPNVHIGTGGDERGADTDSSGKFRMEVRAGTQTLEFKAIGFVPERFAVNIEADRDTSLTVALTSLKKMMDTIKVMAERSYWADRGGFTLRKRAGIGTFIDEKEIARHATFDAVDALRRVPGIRIVGTGMFKRVLMTQYNGGACVPSLFLDGFRMQLGPADLDNINPNEIGGIEVYRSAAEVPMQFQSLDGCGTIVVWTRPPRPTKIR